VEFLSAGIDGIRVAEALGLSYDGQTSSMTKYELTEYNRRCWQGPWGTFQVINSATRASESRRVMPVYLISMTIDDRKGSRRIIKELFGQRGKRVV